MASSFTVPPGLKGDFTGVAASGGDDQWLPYEPEKPIRMVNAFVHDQVDHKILSVWVKEGFGVGHYMPFLAPFNLGDDLFEASKAAVKSQTGGVEVTEISEAGGFFVVIAGNPTPIEVVAHRVTAWTGKPVETADRRPEWFASTVASPSNASLPPLPYDKMMEDEQYWWPHFCAGKKVIGRADFAAPAEEEDVVGRLERYWFGFV